MSSIKKNDCDSLCCFGVCLIKNKIKRGRLAHKVDSETNLPESSPIAQLVRAPH